MKRVKTAVILIPVVLGLVFLPSYLQWLFTAAVALVSALAAWECLGLANAKGANPPRIVVGVATVALFAAWGEWQDADRFLPIYGILCLALLLFCTFWSPTDRMMPDATSCIFCLFYTGLTMISLPALREQANGPSLLLYLLFVVWAGDTGAYYAGRAWGRHKLAPRISPGKTLEGSIASVLASMLIAAGLVELADLLARKNLAVLFYSDETIWYWIGLAVVVNVAAQVGDLAESALKRSAGVKDSGSLLPGHGGVLDRIDALLVASPVLWYTQVLHHSF